MSGLIEMGVIVTGVAGACSATTTLGIATYAHRKTAHLRANNNHVPVDVTQKSSVDGPLRTEGVQVIIDKVSLGKRGIEFNGEILFVASDDGSLSSAMAVGAADVQIDRNRVTVVPPSLPTLELTFPSRADALEWAKELEEARLVGPPQERIQELITHSVDVEKHIQDLIGRAQSSEDLEKRNEKLRRDLGLSNEACSASSSSRRWFSPSIPWFASDDHGDDHVDILKMQVEEHRMNHEKATALADDLRRKMSEHISPEVHDAVHEEMQLHRKESSRAMDEVVELRRQVDELAPLVSGGEANLTQIRQVLHGRRQKLAADFAQRYKDVQMQLAISNQKVREEKVRADFRTSHVQSLLQEKRALLARIEEIKNTRATSCAASTDGSRQQQPSQSVEEIVLANHEQLQAQRVTFMEEIEEQRLQQEMEMRELKLMYEKSGLVMPSQGVAPIASDLGLPVGELTYANINLKEQLTRQDRCLEMERVHRADLPRKLEESNGHAILSATSREGSFVWHSPSEARALGSPPLFSVADIPAVSVGSPWSSPRQTQLGVVIKGGSGQLRMPKGIGSGDRVLQGGSANYAMPLVNRRVSTPRQCPRQFSSSAGSLRNPQVCRPSTPAQSSPGRAEFRRAEPQAAGTKLRAELRADLVSTPAQNGGPGSLHLAIPKPSSQPTLWSPAAASARPVQLNQANSTGTICCETRTVSSAMSSTTSGSSKPPIGRNMLRMNFNAF